MPIKPLRLRNGQPHLAAKMAKTLSFNFRKKKDLYMCWKCGAIFKQSRKITDTPMCDGEKTWLIS